MTTTLDYIPATLPPNEEERLRSLNSLHILDTEPEERYDRVTRLAKDIFEVPVVFISLIDRERQWFKSRQGVNICETSRDTSFCAHTILGTETVVIEDTLLDKRFARNPHVIGEPHIRFYAGHPLAGPQNQNIGTLCVADQQPRAFGSKEKRMLVELARVVEHELFLFDRLESQERLLEAHRSLHKSQQHLRQELFEAGQYVRSLLPPKITKSPIKVDWSFHPSEHLGGDAFHYYWLNDHTFIFFLLDVAGHGLGAALFSVSILESLREKSLSDVDFTNPGKVLEALNRTFTMSKHGNKFFTLWYGVYNSTNGELAYATGGHPQTILLRKENEKPELLGPPGHLVGAFANINYQNQYRTLQKGDRLFVFSDGLYEAADPLGDRWSIGQLGEFFLEQNPTLSAEQLTETVRLTREIETFQDDVSLLRLIFD